MTDLYRMVKAHRGDILFMVNTLNTFMFIKVQKTDLLNQIMVHNIDLDEVDVELKYGGDQLYISRKD
jgi:hypothetical protein